ncbi:MAG TPA: hypothetical protein VKD72_29145 [Gemmataceae bacterium]|nr:hypothetical protein [Gemmataceae bacterium]
MRGRWVLLHLKYRRHLIPAAAVPQAGGRLRRTSRVTAGTAVG